LDATSFGFEVQSVDVLRLRKIAARGAERANVISHRGYDVGAADPFFLVAFVT
jgi:hypothetical protein